MSVWAKQLTQVVVTSTGIFLKAFEPIFLHFKVFSLSICCLQLLFTLTMSLEFQSIVAFCRRYSRFMFRSLWFKLNNPLITPHDRRSSLPAMRSDCILDKFIYKFIQKCRFIKGLLHIFRKRSRNSSEKSRRTTGTGWTNSTLTWDCKLSRAGSCSRRNGGRVDHASGSISYVVMFLFATLGWKCRRALSLGERKRVSRCFGEILPCLVVRDFSKHGCCTPRAYACVYTCVYKDLIK